MDAVYSVIDKMGFPIFVACWFMFRLEKKIEKTLEMQSKILDLIEDAQERAP